jgi:CMP-N,N'-diacetyllegionaminic acid synthase
MRNKIKKDLIALIPARSGSHRIKHKNIENLGGHPLIAHTINSAIKSKLFKKVVVLTDSIKYAKIAKYYGAEIPFIRTKKISSKNSPDYEWVNTVFKFYKKEKINFSHYFILRPTSPFRTAKSIKSAWEKFSKNKSAESLRAIKLVSEHPGKMWVEKNNFIKALINGKVNKQPYYNSQYTTLPKVYAQDASLEISRLDVIKKYKTITGKKILSYHPKNLEGFDINFPIDLIFAKFLIKEKLIKLQKISKKTFFKA